MNVPGSRELAHFALEPVPGAQFALYPALPKGFSGQARLELKWMVGKRVIAEDEKMFRVERFPEPVPRTGRVRLRVANGPGVTQTGMPVTAGVPFPRGVLADTANLRLVDEAGRELPLQVSETARWSKFGTVKWVLCDFTVDLAGGARELYLEYGPHVSRQTGVLLGSGSPARFPALDAGRLRFANGLWYDAAGNGRHQKVLEAGALSGAFVEREDGRVYRMPEHGAYEVEEQGPEKLVLRRKGWYRDGAGDEFCQYLVRYVIHRNSPVLRVFHTWIFTGDGNRERIADMGWRFPLAEGFRPCGFLAAFDPDGQWLEGDYLLQWDYAHYEVASGGTTRDFPGRRAPGAAAAVSSGVRLYFGAKDFWENYPSELEFRDGAFWFHNWPRHNKAARWTLDKELIAASGPPALPSAARYAREAPDKLTRSEWTLNVVQARFAHEGRLLAFRLPDAIGEDPIWSAASAGLRGEAPCEKGNVQTANAQGISRTEELWLYLAPANVDQSEAVRLLQGLNDETLRAVVDPAWVAGSGAFYEIHPQDWTNFPEDERLFELVALAYGRWQEQMGVYGKWIYGDIPGYQWNLDRRETRLYRAYRKRHHGWPYSWTPYARSGDPRLLKLAEGSTRQNIDANFCHYVGEEVVQRLADMTVTYPTVRRVGLVSRGLLPWASRSVTARCYECQCDFLWAAYYLTGYHRAKDVALLWGAQTKKEEPYSSWPGNNRVATNNGRTEVTLLKSYLEMYEATFDPWFLVFAHAIAEGRALLYRKGMSYGTDWAAGDREFLRFTGDEGEFRDYYLAYARMLGGHLLQVTGGWGHRYYAPMVEPNAYAWHVTRDRYHLRRLSYFLHIMKSRVWDGEKPDYWRGHFTAFSPSLNAWTLQYFPLALAALSEAGHRPEPVHNICRLRGPAPPVIALKKETGRPVAMTIRASGRQTLKGPYTILGPEGEVFSAGEWQSKREFYLRQPGGFPLVIPGAAPAGVYRLKIENAPALAVPMTEDLATPEVMLFDPEELVPLTHCWFRVGRGVKRFWVELPLNVEDTRVPLRQVSVWGPEGKLAWRLSWTPDGYASVNPARAEITVGTEQAGKLWLITGVAHGFRVDPQIPPRYSASPQKWFADGERDAVPRD